MQDRKAKAAPRYADDTRANSDAPKRWSDYTVQFEFPEPTELPPPLIQLNDVSFQYPGRDDFGLKDLNIGVDMGSRVAIVGPNGAGKTTLMNLLSGMSAYYLCYMIHNVQRVAKWDCEGRGGLTVTPRRENLLQKRKKGNAKSMLLGHDNQILCAQQQPRVLCCPLQRSAAQT